MPRKRRADDETDALESHPASQAKVAMAVRRGKKTLLERPQLFEVYGNQITIR